MDDKVICPICNKKFDQLNNSHFKLHNTTIEKIKKQNPLLNLKSNKVRQKEIISLQIQRKRALEVMRSNRINFAQNRLKLYNLEPTLCKNCNKKINLVDLLHKEFNNQFKLLYKTTKNCFCTRSCATIFNNTHKKHGTRRSKLEIFLEQELLKKYEDLEFHFNKKDTINSELDIYIPSLKLAFELNGIYHYEPIYSVDQLSKIQNNDNRKFQACLEQKIELCVINTSEQKVFKPATSERFLSIITSILDNKICSTGFEPALTPSQGVVLAATLRAT